MPVQFSSGELIWDKGADRLLQVIVSGAPPPRPTPSAFPAPPNAKRHDFIPDSTTKFITTASRWDNHSKVDLTSTPAVTRLSLGCFRLLLILSATRDVYQVKKTLLRTTTDSMPRPSLPGRHHGCTTEQL